MSYNQPPRVLYRPQTNTSSRQQPGMSYGPGQPMNMSSGQQPGMSYGHCQPMNMSSCQSTNISSGQQLTVLYQPTTNASSRQQPGMSYGPGQPMNMSSAQQLGMSYGTNQPMNMPYGQPINMSSGQQPRVLYQPPMNMPPSQPVHTSYGQAASISSSQALQISCGCRATFRDEHCRRCGIRCRTLTTQGFPCPTARQRAAMQPGNALLCPEVQYWWIQEFSGWCDARGTCSSPAWFHL